MNILRIAHTEPSAFKRVLETHFNRIKPYRGRLYTVSSLVNVYLLRNLAFTTCQQLMPSEDLAIAAVPFERRTGLWHSHEELAEVHGVLLMNVRFFIGTVVGMCVCSISTNGARSLSLTSDRAIFGGAFVNPT